MSAPRHAVPDGAARSRRAAAAALLALCGLVGRSAGAAEPPRPWRFELGAGVASRPDGPPMPAMRGQPRLVCQPSLDQRVLDLDPSPANALELCVGSLAEMTEGDVHEAVEQYAKQGRIGYVHPRNVRGKVPFYKETFIDDGDVDVLRVLSILHRHGFDGVIVPDHAPQMSCAAPWHAGMAFAMGYLQAGLKSLGTS